MTSSSCSLTGCADWSADLPARGARNLGDVNRDQGLFRVSCASFCRHSFVHRRPGITMSKACSGDVPGDGLARGALTSRTPSNACGDVSARQSMVSHCVETPARHLRLTTLLVPIPSTTDRTWRATAHCKVPPRDAARGTTSLRNACVAGEARRLLVLRTREGIP